MDSTTTLTDCCEEELTSFLEDMETEAERSEALALLQSETERTGLRSIGAFSGLPPWFIPPHRVQLGKHLATGSFGAVYEGIYLDTPVVVKQALVSGLAVEGRRHFRREADLWFSLNHPNLIKLFGACHEGRPSFVCERAKLVTIVASTNKWLIRDFGWAMFCHAAEGLHHLHDHGIVHGDLKGNNILVGDTWKNVKLADFGLSLATNKTYAITVATSGALGAFRWKAPEVLRGDKTTFASDIYSFGMCIIEAVTGQFPWGSTISDAVVRHHVVEWRLLPQRPLEFNDEQWELVVRMCCCDPEKRISAGAVVRFLEEFK